MVRSKLCPDVLWVHGISSPAHDVFVKRIFYEQLTIWVIVNARRIRFVVSKSGLALPSKASR
jgi:hypothetical protein